MSRTSTLPTPYATIGDLERGFIHHVRRFRRACAEVAAPRTIVLNAPTLSDGDARARAPGAPADPRHAQLDLLHSQILLLQNMSAQILTNFPGDARATKIRAAVDQWLRQIEQKSEELRVDLGKVARKAVDRAVVVRNHALMTELQSSLKKNLGGVTEMYLQGQALLPGMRGEPTPCDFAYLRLTDLRGPDGFVHPSYYVITAHPTGAGNGRLAPMYVSASPDYRLPLRVRWSATARTPAELRRVVVDALLGEGVITSANGRDLPVPAADVRFVHDNIKKTTVQGNLIRVLVKDRDQIEETRAAIRRQLTSIVRRADPRNRDVVRDRVDPAKGVILLTFSLPGNLRGRIVDPDVLRRIGTLLDVDATTLQRIRTAIEDPE